MWKPRFINILLYFLVKYIVFFAIVAFTDNRFKSIVIDNSVNNREFFFNTIFYIIYVLAFSFFPTAIFSVPVYLIFKVKNAFYFVLLMSFMLASEYFIFIFLNSQEYVIDKYIIYYVGISMLFLGIFFFKHIKLILNQKLQ
jgi:hypothetical protein